jgi:hypothetical protein
MYVINLACVCSLGAGSIAKLLTSHRLDRTDVICRPPPSPTHPNGAQVAGMGIAAPNHTWQVVHALCGVYFEVTIMIYNYAKELARY